MMYNWYVGRYSLETQVIKFLIGVPNYCVFKAVWKEEHGEKQKPEIQLVRQGKNIQILELYGIFIL